MLNPKTGQLVLHPSLPISPEMSKEELIQLGQENEYAFGQWQEKTIFFVIRHVPCLNGSITARVYFKEEKIREIRLAVGDILGRPGSQLPVNRQWSFMLASIGMKDCEPYLLSSKRVDFPWGSLWKSQSRDYNQAYLLIYYS